MNDKTIYDMTTDDFTKAANIEAWSRYPESDNGEQGLRIGFKEGAEWAHDHLAAQMPQVIIRHEEGNPSVCEVRQGGVLIFSGRDHSADLRVAAQEPTDAERAVRELHTPREEQVVTGDCSIEECDHEDECPTVPFLVCAECWRVADEADTYFAERGVGHVAHPCPTVQALDSARAARRDEEKR